MSAQSKQANILVMENCTIADAALVSTGEVMIPETATGTAYVLDQNGDVIASQAQVDTLRTFKIVQNVNGAIISTGDIDPKTITHIVGKKAQFFKGDRLIVGAVENITAADAPLTILPDTTYSIQMKIASGTDPDVKQNSYILAARSGSVGEIKANLIIDLATSSGRNAEFNKLFRCVAVSDAIAAGNATITARQNKAQISYTGTLLEGTYLAYEGASADGRIEPRAVYRVDSVNDATKTATLNQYWVSGDITAVAVDKIALVDTDNWGLLVESKSFIYTGIDGQQENIEPMVDFYTSEFSYSEILKTGSNVSGCSSIGHYLNAERMQKGNDEFLTGIIPTANVTKDYYYSVISIVAKSTPTSRTQVTPIDVYTSVLLKKSTKAQIVVGTAVTWGNNVWATPGTVPQAQGGLINTLNAIAIKFGLFRNAANTINNGGGYLTNTIDF